jgi:hypothetical protein
MLEKIRSALHAVAAFNNTIDASGRSAPEPAQALGSAAFLSTLYQVAAEVNALTEVQQRMDDTDCIPVELK